MTSTTAREVIVVLSMTRPAFWMVELESIVSEGWFVKTERSCKCSREESL